MAQQLRSWKLKLTACNKWAEGKPSDYKQGWNHDTKKHSTTAKAQERAFLALGMVGPSLVSEC